MEIVIFFRKILLADLPNKEPLTDAVKLSM